MKGKMKTQKIAFRATPKDQEILEALSNALQRNKSDTLRHIMRRAYFSLQEQIEPLENNEKVLTNEKTN